MTKFRLTDTFIKKYKNKAPKFGPLGEFIFLRTYARSTEDGKLEKFYQTVQRVVEGTYNIQKNHCNHFSLPWNERKAQTSAQKMFDKIWNFKFIPPGRGLWLMGTSFVEKKGGAGLNNCGFVSTEEINTDFSSPFCWVMDMSMLGVGCGFDTRGRHLELKLKSPRKSLDVHDIDDTREGWVNAVRRVLDAFVGKDTLPDKWDFSLIRKEGEPIKGFGGVSSGSKPLETLIKEIQEECNHYLNKDLCVDSTLITNLMNEIGACVVSGNIRRSAEIAFSEIEDSDFIDLKNPENFDFNKKPRWASNNSVIANLDSDYSEIAENIIKNGEPGILWLENAQKFRRIDSIFSNKKYDWRARGTNPCGEQTLESFELCCLVETFPFHHDSLEEYLETLKYAYLYAKTVTLVKTHDERTNAVLMRNRRIGTSQSGIIQNINKIGMRNHLNWCDIGYTSLKELDTKYSEWLCVPKSIKITSVKPSGTVSLLCGASPGIHFPHSKYYIRRVRVSNTDPMISAVKEAGYSVEPDTYNPNYSSVIEFPVEEGGFKKGKSSVSMWEQLELASQMQTYWADNQVSITVNLTERDSVEDLKSALELYSSRLKSVSFLPYSSHGYSQPPYEEISEKEYLEKIKKLKKINFDTQTIKESDFCDGDSCTIDFSSHVEPQSKFDSNFLDKVEITSSCWFWKKGKRGSKDGNKYGSYWTEGHSVSAHVYAFEVYYGKIEDKTKVVRHLCNNSFCVNPLHLALGTIKDNVSDAFNSNRRNPNKGAKHKNSKLTENEVKEIKSKYRKGKSQHELAVEYSVSRSSIRNIVTGVSWKHVE